MDKTDIVDSKDNELLTPMYMVIGIGQESHLAYAIFSTKAEAYRWQLQEGMRDKTQLFKC